MTCSYFYLLILPLIICLFTVVIHCFVWFSDSDCLEETGDDVVCVNAIEESAAVIVNEPAGHIFSVLHILSEIFLPTPVDTE